MDDKHFAYCGAQSSEIAIAARENTGIWRKHTSAQLETAGLFKTDPGCSDVHDPTTDGEGLIIRLAPAYSECEDV
jgi:hypothetical protein